MSRNSDVETSSSLGTRSIGYPKKVRIKDRDAFGRVVARDRGICLACWKELPGGWGSATHIHHIKTRGSGGDDVLENLITLCVGHHEAAHKKDISTEELRGILADAYNYIYTG